MGISVDRLREGDLSEDEKRELYAELVAAKEELCWNGIDCATGEYGIQPMTAGALSSVIRGDEKPENLGELSAKSKLRAFPIKGGVDPTQLSQAGWAAIVAAGENPAILVALKPLLDLREEQAGDRFRVYSGPTGFQPSDTKRRFFERNKIGDGPADPDQLGYYVLLIGSPESIPYSFQYQLDVMRGVGRIYFETLEEYANYARSVVLAESGRVKLARRAVFFGPRNADDKATNLTARHLIGDLSDKVRRRLPLQRAVSINGAMQTQQIDWQVDSIVDADATKARLGQLIGGAETPALLFTASHGAEFPSGHARQLQHQGALICQDWPGPRNWRGALPDGFYFSGDDISANAQLLGLISFHFACFGGGTPKLEQFARQARRDTRKELAPQDFVAKLPRRMLGHEKGGALATIAHIERAWGYSFLSPTALVQTGMFESVVAQLLAGDPVGWVTESINLRYADLAASLTTVLEELSFDEAYMDAYELAALWTHHNDARGYALIGDPAVRVPFTMEQPEERPSLGSIITDVLPPTPTPEPSPPAPAANAPLPQSAGAISFAADDDRPGLLASLQNSLSNFALKVAEGLADVTSLEVSTYSSEDLSRARYNFRTKGMDGARLRALTHIAFDGDIHQCVPEKAGNPDKELWQLHLEAVRLAQQNRAELIKTLAEMATKLVAVLQS